MFRQTDFDLRMIKFGVFDHLDDSGHDVGEQYRHRLDLAEACDRSGFWAYHVAEHHGTPHGLAPAPNMFLSAMAQRTRRLRLGPLVMLLNLYHPLRAFEEICMLDQLSGGRLDLGIGRGASPIEMEFFGVDPAEAQDRYSEAADIVLKAMQVDRLDHHGRYFDLKDVPITLSPVQRPHPPLWYGTAKPETAAWAAQEQVNLACIGTASTVRGITDAYRSRWAETAAPGAAMPLLGMVRHVVIADSDREALDLAGPAYTRWADSPDLSAQGPRHRPTARAVHPVFRGGRKRKVHRRLDLHRARRAAEAGCRSRSDLRHVPPGLWRPASDGLSGDCRVDAFGGHARLRRLGRRLLVAQLIGSRQPIGPRCPTVAPPGSHAN